MKKILRKPYIFWRIELLWNNQISRTLPRRFWERVTIQENNEPMELPTISEKLICCPATIFPGIETSFAVRKTVSEKLTLAADQLPDNYRLCVIEGYRSQQKQEQAWNRKKNQVAIDYPKWTPDQIESEVRLVVAKPGGITNHVCGGAVDVMLQKKNQQGIFEYCDFGTSYAAIDREGRKKCPMFASGLTVEQIENRILLRDSMTRAGFVYYPGEWWHYCYGDRMWAVYTGRTECFYGPTE